MLKVLIVDDEELILSKLERIVSQPTLPFREVLKASNAPEAMELIRLRQPDIILTDIRMPQVSGLELARYVHQNYPQLIVILITGYSDFDYAAAGIQSGVFDYILKPVEHDITLAAIRRAVQKRQMELKHQRLYESFQGFFSENRERIRRQVVEELLFAGGQWNLQQREALPLLGLQFSAYRLVAFCCRMGLAKEPAAERYYFHHAVVKYLRKRFPDSPVYCFGTNIYLIWQTPDGDKEPDRLLSHLKKAVGYLESNFLIVSSVGISSQSDSLEELRHLRRQTAICIESTSAPQSEIVFFDDLNLDRSQEFDAIDAVSQLGISLRARNRRHTLDILGQIFAHAQGRSPDYQENMLRMTFSQLNMVLYEMGWQEGARLKPELYRTAPDRGFQDTATEILREVERLFDELQQEQSSRSNQHIDSIFAYIGDHFHEPVGLTEVSEHIHRNPSYTSRLIRQFTGKTFTQILTERRITEAKRLLEQDACKLQEIAQRVGYPNLRYFNRIFQVQVGMTAGDYRKVMSSFADD